MIDIKRIVLNIGGAFLVLLGIAILNEDWRYPLGYIGLISGALVLVYANRKTQSDVKIERIVPRKEINKLSEMNGTIWEDWDMARKAKRDEFNEISKGEEIQLKTQAFINEFDQEVVRLDKIYIELTAHKKEIEKYVSELREQYVILKHDIETLQKIRESRFPKSVKQIQERRM